MSLTQGKHERWKTASDGGKEREKVREKERENETGRET